MGGSGPSCPPTHLHPLHQGDQCPPASNILPPIPQQVVAAIFLFLVFFISLAGNSLIISTVGSSLTLRRLNYNLLLLQVLSGISLVEIQTSTTL